MLEQRVKEAVQEIERIRERVRVDMRRIRVREKELENRLEITTKDSEVLIAARENKIIDLKRKIDLSEFNLDLLQDKLQMEYEKNKELKDRLAKVGSAMKVAESWIEGESSNDDQMTQESEASAEDHDFYEDAS